MLNRPLLLSQLALHEMTRSALAEKLGWSKSTLYRKINGKTDFTAQEIDKCYEVLELSADMASAIFFSREMS